MEINLANGYLLRPWDAAWRDGDQGRFVTLANDYDIWVNLRDRFPHPYTRADAEDWIALQSGRDPTTVFAICDAEGPIGAIGLETREADYRHSAELGYWLGKPFWGRGIMTTAAKVVTAYGFHTLGLMRIDGACQGIKRRLGTRAGEGGLPTRRAAPQGRAEGRRARGLLALRHPARGLNLDIPAGNYLIRAWRPEDAESLSTHLDNPNVTGQLLARHPRPYTVERARAWIDLCAIEADPVNFAITDKQDAIGGVSLYLQRGARGRSAEIGFWVAEPFWGKGVASVAVGAFVDYAFTQFDLARLYANVFSGNGASVRVLEKIGLVYEGTMARAYGRTGASSTSSSTR